MAVFRLRPRVEVLPGAEAPPRAGEDDAAHRRVPLRTPERLLQLREHRVRHRVQHIGPVERQRQYAVRCSPIGWFRMPL